MSWLHFWTKVLKAHRQHSLLGAIGQLPYNYESALLTPLLIHQFHHAYYEVCERAVWGHDHLCAAWGVDPITPLDGSLIGSMATLELPEGIRSKHHSDVELHDLLLREHSIEVPIMDWGGKLWLRISAQAYNRPDDYRRLADVIASMG